MFEARAMWRQVIGLTTVVLVGAVLSLPVGPALGADRDKVPAKKLFGAKQQGAKLTPRAIGFYSRGCLAGGKALPIDGPAWQAMRLKRNRNWGHPVLVKLVQRLATESQEFDGWPGLLIGDISQPRGGPMLSGHRSHQIGLDADIWMMPMPENHRFSKKERNNKSAVSMLASKTAVDPKLFKPGHVKLLKRAASYREVERILVHPAIKKALCDAAGSDRKWLAKVRPYWGHHYHFHMRIGCPKGSTNCKRQKSVSGDDGCGKEIAYWFKLLTQKKKKAKKPKKKYKPRPPVRLAGLPPACRKVLDAKPTGELGADKQVLVPQPTPVSRKGKQGDAGAIIGGQLGQ